MRGRMTSSRVDGEKLLRELIHDMRDSLSDLMERWDHRRTPEGISIVEEYFHGRLSLVVYLEPLLDGKTCNWPVSHDLESHRKRQDFPALVYQRGTLDVGEMQDRDQEPVLVRQVETVKGPQGNIGSLVGLQFIQYERDDVRRRSLYASVLNGCFHFLSGSLDRKVGLGVFLGNSVSDAENCLPHNMIEGGAQVVDGVTNGERDAIWQWMRDNFQKIVGGIAIGLDSQVVNVALGKGIDRSVRLVDVFVGPFDL